MPTDPTFRMTVQDVLSIKGRGTVVTGRIESGTIAVGNEIRIQGKSSNKPATVHSVEVNRKVTTQAQTGDTVGILFKDLTGEDVEQGDVLTGSEFDFTGSHRLVSVQQRQRQLFLSHRRFLFGSKTQSAHRN